MKQRATDDQILAALERHKGIRARAAADLGLGVRSVMFRIDAMKARGVKVPESTYDGRHGSVTGTSTLYDADGKQVLQWVKESAGQRTPEQWAEVVREVFAGTERVKPIPRPKVVKNRLYTVIPVGDHHHAMYSYAAETGADWDIKISSHTLMSAATHLIDVAPTSDRCLIANVGDFFHTDNFKNQTPASGNVLDVDTRYSVMIRSGVEMLRAMIDGALAKFNIVEVENAGGNHDPVGALWLSLALSLLYEKNPRVRVNTAPAKAAYYRHGKVLIGVTHGDMKVERLPGIMASDRPEDWGQTKHRYWFTGHIHQRKVQEFPGCMVESFRTLAARDAWATAEGYRSGRDMMCVTFHEEYGEIARHRFDIAMLE